MTKKQVHELQQGSEAWAQFRLQHNGASEAAAMLGLSPYMTRPELLKMKKLGLAREFSDFVQKRVLDKGHEIEALARPHIEALIGAELYPATYSLGRESASCDGITLDDVIAAEHKQFSDELFAQVQAGVVPEHHLPQCQQILMVTGAEKLAFVCSDGTPQRMAIAWVYPDPAWFQRLRDGWRQFDRDLEAFELPPAAEAAPVGRAPETLPALRIEITGAVTASNLAEFRETALGAIRSVNRDLQTDQHFADAEKAVKWCGEVENRLAAAKEHALSQTATIDALFKTIDEIAGEARRVRLDLDRLVTRRKAEVKEAAVAAAREALALHLDVVNAEIAPARLTHAADLAGAIKGLKTLDSVRAKLDAAVAAAKVEIDGKAREVRKNLDHFREVTNIGTQALFPDLAQLVLKAPADFRDLVQARALAQQERDRKAEAERQAAEAARIAAAEQRAREQAEAAAAERLRQEQAAAATEQRRQEAAAAEAQRALAQASAPVAPAPAVVSVSAPVAAPRAAAVPPADDEPATLKLGDICGRLGFTVSAAFLADTLHIRPARTDGRAALFSERQYQQICSQLRSHIGAVAELYAVEGVA